jgi:hypothetical protein
MLRTVYAHRKREKHRNTGFTQDGEVEFLRKG